VRRCPGGFNAHMASATSLPRRDAPPPSRLVLPPIGQGFWSAPCPSQAFVHPFCRRLIPLPGGCGRRCLAAKRGFLRNNRDERTMAKGPILPANHAVVAHKLFNIRFANMVN